MRTKGEGDGFQCREGMTLPVILLDLLLSLQGATRTLLPAVPVPVTVSADQKGGQAANVSLVVLYPRRLFCVANMHRPERASQKPSTMLWVT